ncbi:hypothetical protein JKP88DRAFT_252851 [Tribonema minus]|uniref:Uncharacterized protein n=1 Tax=Tribonema minus TaxID=303371 RepID=A0A835Z9C1_9STRA|nr:hypothetical protein JKP88DRAFT_252851 [Tribonema minus]
MPAYVNKNAVTRHARTTFCWAALLSVRSIFYKAPSEIIHSVAQTIWLLGNMWWMIGELDDLRTFGTWADEYETHTQQAAWMLTAAMCLLATHYLIFRPLGLYNDRENPLVKMYNDIHPPLKPRLPVYFTDWRLLMRQAADCHHNCEVMWLVFMIPTVLVAADFVLLSWVLGNMVWALGDNFFAEDATERQDMWHEPYHWKTMRWWASWAFLMAFVPFAILYMVWIPCSLLNKHIAPSDHKDGKALSVTTDAEAAS